MRAYCSLAWGAAAFVLGLATQLAYLATPPPPPLTTFVNEPLRRTPSIYSRLESNCSFFVKEELKENMLLKSVLAGLASAQGFRDLEKKSVEVPRIGTDVIVSCEGTRIAAKVMRSYIERNSKWLGSGQDLSLDVDRYTDVRDCAGTRDDEGNYILEVTDDFQKCGMQISPETEKVDGEVVVTGYKVNHAQN